MDEKKAASVAVKGVEVEPRKAVSNYPEPFASRMAGREKRILGNLFGLKTFGINLTKLSPGAVSSLHHVHSRQDEMIWIVEGEPTLVTNEGETSLASGMCAGFPAGGTAHHLENRTSSDVLYLEIGDRGLGDVVDYPLDDLQLVTDPATGKLRFARKNGSFY
jgi:uncharacterized cupin superfamily protein